jgi:hypothetical protein
MHRGGLSFTAGRAGRRLEQGAECLQYIDGQGGNRLPY